MAPTAVRWEHAAAQLRAQPGPLGPAARPALPHPQRFIYQTLYREPLSECGTAPTATATCDRPLNTGFGHKATAHSLPLACLPRHARCAPAGVAAGA